MIGNIWFSFLVLELIYVLPILLVNLFPTLGANEPGKWIFFVGLFTPFGVWNTIGSLNMLGSPFVIVIGGLAITQYISNKIDLNVATRILVNLVALMFLTFLVDMIVWNRWCSWLLATTGDCGSGF